MIKTRETVEVKDGGLHKMERLLYYLWFSRINSLNIRQKNALLKSFKDPKTIFALGKDELLKTGIFKKKESLEAFSRSRTLEKLEDDLDYMKKNHIDFIPVDDIRFPQKLREIYSPPVGIYIKGDADLLQAKPAVAIVGSRNPSKAALKYAGFFSRTLSTMGITIISGLAEGVDGKSHWASLNEIGKTVAVLGHGLDQCYPAHHEKLFKEIGQKGLLITEFNLGDKPLGYHFPMRNRLISGLSDGLLVVEARKKSGSLITVNHALDQGKNVYVIPGEIDNPHWAGSNSLLKEGAKFVTEPKDILEDFVVINKNTKSQKLASRIKIKFTHPDDEQIYNAIIKGYDTVDDLVGMTGLSVVELSSRLTMMEIDELIKTDYGKLKICDDFS